MESLVSAGVAPSAGTGALAAVCDDPRELSPA